MLPDQNRWEQRAQFSSSHPVQEPPPSSDVQEGRPFWHTRCLAVGLTFMLGVLASVVLAAMILGPELGGRIAHHFGMDPLFTKSWFYFRWVLATSFSILAVELV